MATAVLDFFDPHFHVWDVSEGGKHDGSVLFSPSGKSHYGVKAYENDVAGCGMRHVGGVFVEAMSVCFVKERGDSFEKRCLEEVEWAGSNLSRSSRKYAIVASLALEEDNSVASLRKLAKRRGTTIRGIRQILNYEPSWPRNAQLGNLLRNESWWKGFAALEAVDFSFDMQINPHQFEDAYALIQAYPKIRVIINHLGCPTLDDLKDPQKSSIYWNGLKKLASCPNVCMKISMLCYIYPDWDGASKDGKDESKLVIASVHRVIETFGTDRCFFASNYPVDIKDGWAAERLFLAFRRLAAIYPQSVRRKLFSENAARTYRVDISTPATISAHITSLHASNQTVRSVASKHYWLQICPDLHIADDAFMKSTMPLRLDGALIEDVRNRIDREGYAHVTENALRWNAPVKSGTLAKAVRRLLEFGWPPTFLLIFDEAWSMIQNMSGIMRDASGGNRLNFDILAWHIDPRKDEAGFSPHRDRQPANVSETFRESDGSAKYTTCWIALTDAVPDNSCLYMIPKFVDPGYMEGDDAVLSDGDNDNDSRSATGPLWRALKGKESFQHIRAVPAPTGSAVMFTHRTIHWGSKGRKSFSDPRISFSFAASDDTFEPAYLSRSHLPYPRLDLRLALAGAQMIAYFDRFDFSSRELRFFNDLFKSCTDEFHETYKAKVVAEFMAASERALYGSSSTRTKRKRDDDKNRGGATKKSADTDIDAEKEEEEEEEDILDSALDAMLDAELSGAALFRDDFDDDHGM